MRIVALLIVVGCGTATTTTGAKRDTLASIPEAAAAALRQQAGGVPIDHVEREHEGGVEVFEASWRVNGLEREAAVTARGELVELEEEVPSAAVPEPVRVAVTAKHARAQSIKYVKVMPAGVYEVEYVEDGKHGEALFAADGRAVTEGEEDDDDDDEHEHD